MNQNRPFVLIFAALVILLGPAGLAAISPVERATELAEFFDLLESGATPPGTPPTLEELERTFEELRTYLDTNTDDVRSLILFARLGSVIDLSQPVMFSVNEDIPSSEDSYAPLHTALERAVTLEPDNADAHYWQARLYGVNEPTITDDGRLTSKSKDLNQAIHHGRRAVELEPDEPRYRETLALYLFAAGLTSDAIGVMQDVDGGKHPIYLLLSDLEALPLPKSAVLSSIESKGFAEMQMSRGRYENYPELRARIYTFPGSASELESFFQTQWSGIRLFENDRDENAEGAVVRTLAQHFRWRRGKLQPDTEKNVSRALKDPKGILLMIIELRAPTESMRQRWGQLSADPFCVLYFTNLRKSRG
jgi:tetratricopeptide (TPR) repeat protein